MQTVPTLQEDMSNLARRLRDEDGPVETDRRYALVSARPLADRQHCGPWVGLIAVEDAVHEGRSGDGVAASLIEFDMEGMSMSAGQSAVPDMVVRGSATATRLEMPDGRVGDPLAPVPPAADPATAPGVEVATLATERDTPTGSGGPAGTLGAGPATGTSRPAEPAPGAAAEWPGPIDTKLEAARRDLLGVRPGQSMAEAAEILAALEGVEATFETSAPLETEVPGDLALGYQRVFLLRGGREALSIASYAPEGEVIAVMRRMVVPGGSLPWDRIAGALEEKYGAPDTRLEEGALLGWNEEATQHCFMLPYAMPARHRFAPADGGQGRLELGRDSAIMIGMPSFPPEIEAMYSGCGEVLAYREERPRDWGRAGFNVVLIDFNRLEEVRAALGPDPALASDFDIEF